MRSHVRLVAAGLGVASLVSCAPAAPAAHSTSGAPTTAAAAASSHPSRGCGKAPPTPAGQDRHYTIPIDPALANGASHRTAVVHIPSGYAAGTPVPLVMEFHGAGPSATAEGYEASSPLRALSDIDGFIDVFPQGLRYTNGNLGWNAYGPVYVKIAEIPFVDKVLDAVGADYCVDTARVYASGVSNGGNMVNYVACRDALRFAAVAPVVGPMFGQDDGPCRPARPVPMLDIHSVNDPLVQYGGHPGPPLYDFPLASVPAWLDGWATLDGCAPAPAAVTGSDSVSKRMWSQCSAGAQIVAYTTHAGHAWPAELDGRPAAQTVWSFLSAYRLS